MSDLPRRKNPRLTGYDYGQPGYYFVTICTRERGQNILALIASPDGAPAVGAAALGGPSIVNASTPEGPRAVLTAAGEIVAQYIGHINRVYNGQVRVDCFVIMPDHVHLIIQICDAGMEAPVEGWVRDREDGPPKKGRVQDREDGPPRAAAPTIALPEIINALKGLSSKKVGYSLWQRGYYEHIVRNDEDLQNTRQYIRDNPLKWTLNQEHGAPVP